MSEKKQRREKPADDGGGPSAPFWMVTYSDMVTLLLTFFVMLLAMANFEEVGRVDAVFESIRLALGVDGIDEEVIGVDPVDPAQKEDIQEESKLQPVLTAVSTALARHLSDDMVVLTQTPTEIRVMLDDRVLFQPGSAELHPAMYLLLADVGKVLAGQPVEVKVEGHTDETGDTKFNWELSSDRAVAVVYAMQSRGGLEGHKLEARGMGQFRPTSGKNGDSWDRRVELVIRSDSALAFDAVYEVERVTNGGRDGG
jgi:chemotaxis protein MotB